MVRPPPPAAAAEDRKTAHDIFKQLIEINTTDSVGSTTVAAHAMAQRLLDAGFATGGRDRHRTERRKGNMVARYRGKAGSKLRPVLIIGHLDVVEARREDWTTDPFQFVEKDGYYYGRGTQDMKDSDAIAVADFIRMKKEGFVPDRDIILALTADEEGGTFNGVDWLLKNHRDLIDAEFALNPDSGGVATEHGKPLAVEFEATEKLYADYQVLATNPGGHSSLPTPDNAIYHVADALAVLQKSPFPFELNCRDPRVLHANGARRDRAIAADMRAILSTPPDPAAIARLSQDARFNSTMRTTCVRDDVERRPCAQCAAAARRSQRQLPHLSRDIRKRKSAWSWSRCSTTRTHRALPKRQRRAVGSWLGSQGDGAAAAARPTSWTRCAAFPHKLWPGAAVIPIMEDRGIRQHLHHECRHSELWHQRRGDRPGRRARARQGRAREIDSYYTGVEFYYEFLKALTTRKH